MCTYTFASYNTPFLLLREYFSFFFVFYSTLSLTLPLNSLNFLLYSLFSFLCSCPFFLSSWFLSRVAGGEKKSRCGGSGFLQFIFLILCNNVRCGLLPHHHTYFANYCIHFHCFELYKVNDGKS